MKKIIILIVFIILAAAALLFIVSPVGPKKVNGEYQVFSTQEGREVLLGYYKDILATWTVPYEEFDVDTSFGKTHVIRSGDKNKKNMVVLHGAGSNAASWAYCIAELTKKYNVYAIDSIGDIGKSRPVKLPKNSADYSLWLKETLEALGIKKTNLLGASFGSFIAHSFVSQYPEKVDKAVFTAFSYMSSPLELGVIAKMIFFSFSPSLENMEKQLLWLNGGPMKDKSMAQNIIKIFQANAKYGRPSTINPTDISETTVRNIKTPVMIILGDRDPIYKLEKSKDFCKKTNPSIRFEVIPGEGHMFAFNKKAATFELIFDFIK
jgi:pimeloyl-ACP methyl ester carboxylesterase